MKMTTKKGATVETVGEQVHINGKCICHVGRVEFTDELDADKYERMNNAWKLAKRPGNLPKEVAVIEGRILADREIVEALRSERLAWKAAEEAREAARKAEWEAARAEAVAGCPAGKVPAVCVDWFDGIATYRTLDGSAEWQGWDRPADADTGIFYFEESVVAEARERTAQRKDRQARIEAEMKAEEERENARVAECFRKAAETGERVAIRKWTTTRCMNGNDDECSFDNATEWALPDGTAKTTYTCCF